MTLGDFVSLQRGHDLTDGERRSGNVPVMGSAGMNGSHDTAKAKGPGVVVGRSGASFGQVHFCPVDYWPHNTALYVTDFRGNDTRFAYYFLKSLDFSRYNSGSAQPSLNRNFITPIQICVPEPKEQKAIAGVVGALDDKIELNRRMNETLEALAQSLFKSWFVDATQSALPKGWRTSTIGEEVRVVGGSTPSTTKPEFWEGGTHYWATPKDLSNLNSPVLLETERKITDAGIQQISSGLLTVGTVLLSSRAPIGYLVIAEVPVAINQGFIAMICDGSLPNHYVRLWTKTNMDAIEGRANGTTFMEISKGNFRSLPVIVPPKPLLDDFQKQVEPLHRRVVSNLKESRTLAALRDALLPKLLSGELRVPAK
ncbi:MAG: restriction endonuclease subunit S [Limisphaerales bacterium]